MGMKHALVLGMTSAALIVALAGCSTATEKDGSQTSAAETTAAETSTTAADTATTSAEAPAAAPGTGHVKLDNADLGEVTAVTCATDAGITTITVAATPATTVVVTAEDVPSVKSVNIGELGGDGPSMAFVEGVAGSEAKASRQGSSYTVTGTGTGARAADPTTPVDLPFEIAATCP